MKRRPEKRSANRTLFISAEGEDEVGFLSWLRKERGQRRNRLVITFNNAHGGSNPQIVEMAAESEADIRACFMDMDRYLNNPDEREEAESKAHAAGVEILYSDPNFESLLLGVFEIKPKPGKEKAQLREALKNKSPQERTSYDSVISIGKLRKSAEKNKTIESILRIFELN